MKYAVFLLLLLLALAGLYVLAPGPVAKGFIHLGRVVAGLEARGTRAGSLEISYLEGGKGPVLLMIHGFGADKDNWQRFAGFFTDDYRVIAPDLPGFGDSDIPEDMRFDVESQVDHLLSFLAALGIDRLHVAGNSMGGQIAAALTARRPDMITSLALLDPLGVEQEPGVAPTTTMDSILAGDNPLLPANRPAFERMLGHMFYKAPWVPGVVTDYYAEIWLDRRDLLARVYGDITSRYVPLAPLLPTLSTPTLLLWGEDDEILPAAGARVLAAGIRNGTVVVIPECGHLPMIEKPRVTAGHYRKFLDGLPQT